MKVAAFGELVFLESAGICFERALDAAHAEIAHERPEVFVIDERRVQIDFEAELDVEASDELRRFLDVLALDAVEGEVAIHREGLPRWLRIAGTPSGIRESEPAPRPRSAARVR
jgi:hypothetical protein